MIGGALLPTFRLARGRNIDLVERAMGDQQTKTDRLITRLKNNRILSFALVAGIVVIAIASLLNALGDIRDFIGNGKPETPVTQIDPPVPPVAPAPVPAAGGVAVNPPERRLEMGGNTVIFAEDYKLTNLQGYDPAWSGDGRSIVYCSRNYGGQARHGVDLMLSSDGGRTGTPLLSSDSAKFQPLFSFDGRYVAFLASERAPEHRWDARGVLWILPTAGGAPIRASAAGQSVVFDLNYSTNFDWSPVGNQIAYVGEDVEGDRKISRLFIYDVEDRKSRPLGGSRPDAVSAPPWGDGDIARPQWSPDGRRLGVLSGGGGVQMFYYMDTKSDGGSFIHAESVIATSVFDWLGLDTIVYDAGGAGVYRLAKYKLGDQAPSYISRYEYFSDPVVSRNTNIISFTGRSKIGDEGWRIGFQLLRSPGEDAKPVVEVIQKGFNLPIAQHFQERAPAEQVASVPSRLVLDNAGGRGLFAIDEKIFVVDLPPR
jgi:hypothetical protein